MAIAMYYICEITMINAVQGNKSCLWIMPLLQVATHCMLQTSDLVFTIFLIVTLLYSYNDLVIYQARDLPTGEE